MYGKGVYFTNDSSYSLGYCVNDNDSIAGVRPADNIENTRVESFQMYAVKVLVGDFTRGCSRLIAAPSKNDPKNPNLLYDSVVNNMVEPTIFVIFIDHQCYPEYLITFDCITSRKLARR